MDFANRVLWYAIGFGIGIIFVIIFFGNRSDISCNYFPDARVKDNIERKIINYDKTTTDMLYNLSLDSSDISKLLKNGDVIFSKSNTKLDSCKTYYIENKEINVLFENCDSIVNIRHIEITSHKN
ncbi:MAG: hypothetical protein KAH10_06100 [Flavobacteriales bacterium]|nr:hypothetical protein [Flavobacteriales bacterium]